MEIQINTDKNLSVSKEFGDKINAVLQDKLSRFNEYVTRLEVHLSDENGHKSAPNDRKCMIEARVKGLQPIAVTETAKSHDIAISGAIDKMKVALDSMIGKMRTH